MCHTADENPSDLPLNYYIRAMLRIALIWAPYGFICLFDARLEQQIGILEVKCHFRARLEENSRFRAPKNNLEEVILEQFHM